jgi:hypothetical protein
MYVVGLNAVDKGKFLSYPVVDGKDVLPISRHDEGLSKGVMFESRR